MKHLKSMVSALAVLSVASASAHAATAFSVNLDSAQEVSPAGATNSPSLGTGLLEIRLDGNGQLELAFDLIFDAVHDFRPVLNDDLEDPLVVRDANIGDPDGQDGNDVTRLHIHNAARGVNGPVVFGLINPDADLDGDVQVRRRLNGETRVFGAWDIGEGFENFADDLLALGAGEDAPLYFNLHSADDVPGAIRGQIVALNGASEVPIPGALPLMAAGLGILGARRARKNKA